MLEILAEEEGSSPNDNIRHPAPGKTPAPKALSVLAAARCPPVAPVKPHRDKGSQTASASNELKAVAVAPRSRWWLSLDFARRPVQRPDEIFGVELLGAGDEGGAGDHLVPDLLQRVEKVEGRSGELHPPVPLVPQVGRWGGLLGDEADLVERKAVDETRGVDIALPHDQVRHLRGRPHQEAPRPPHRPWHKGISWNSYKKSFTISAKLMQN